MTSEEKTKFRLTKAWKTFRLTLIKDREKTCELCGSVYSGKRLRMLQVHHLFPNDYKNLDPKKFKLVCCSCHDAIEKWEVKLNSKAQNIRNKEAWLSLLKDFLPSQQ